MHYETYIFAWMRKIILILLTAHISLSVNAQVNVKDSLLRAPMIIPNIGVNLPTGDLSKRFGPFYSVGANYLHKTKKNWLFGADAHFLFSSDVKDTSMLKIVTTTDGFIIGSDGTLYDVRYQMRGMQGIARFGKLFPVIGPNKNSGIYATMGVGFMQHKIRFDYERNADLPPISKDYMKGYDRLTNGIAISPSFGYVHLSNSRLLNFFISVDYTAAFTKNRRSWNFDLKAADPAQRFDGHAAFRIGWIIPFYEKKPDEFYFY